jgi:hypothetical protein
MLRHLTNPATQLGFELYLANATLEIAGSGNAYDPHIPLDDIEMLSWPKPKVTLTFSHWVKVGRGPVEAPPFEFEDDQWIPNPPPDDDSFFNKEYDWDLRPVSHMLSYGFLHLKLRARPLESCENVCNLSLHFQERSLPSVHIVTVIVIQSRQVGDDFHMSGISPARASAALRESKASTPTGEEEVLFLTLTKWCTEHLQNPKAIVEPLHALSVSSIRWRDFNRWDSSMRYSMYKKTLDFSPLEFSSEPARSSGSS